MTRIKHFSSLLLMILTVTGCGYSQKTTLPQNIQTIYVDTVKNKIPIQDVYVYEPGLEMDITNAIIRRLHIDGNLRVVEREEADAVLEIDLIDFEQEGLRFTSLEEVEEFRLYIVVDLNLLDGKTKDTIWREPNFTGENEYFVQNFKGVSRQAATEQAVDDLARNVVDRIVEDW